MKKYIIEREIPAIGSKAREELRAAAQKSNEVLAQLAPHIQWVESYVAALHPVKELAVKNNTRISKYGPQWQRLTPARMRHNQVRHKS